MKLKLVIEAEYIPIKSNYPAGLTPKQMAELDLQALLQDKDIRSIFETTQANTGSVTVRAEVVEE